MDKKGLAELKKAIFKKNHIRISHIAGRYINDEKEIISEFNKNLLSMDDDEQYKYIDIFKKVLSGKFGKALYNIPFTAEQESGDGAQVQLMRLRDSELDSNNTADAYFDAMAENYLRTGRLLMLLAYGVYDIPTKSSDGATLEDSEETYAFIIGAMCPVDLIPEGLVFEDKTEEFKSKYNDWGVGKPEAGFLFPSFSEDRHEDIHTAVYFTKSATNRHEEYSNALFNNGLQRTEEMAKTAFTAVIEQTFGRDCTFDAAKNVSDILVEQMEDHAARDEKYVLDKHAMKLMMERAGADDDAMERFEQAYDENIGDEPIEAEAVAEASKIKVKSDDVSLDIKMDSKDLIETRTIDGREYILIPVTNNLTVNDVTVLQSRG